MRLSKKVSANTMAQALPHELNPFGDFPSAEGLLLNAVPPVESPEPLSQEWFRANPQWKTDVLVRRGDESTNAQPYDANNL
jgi:hypothetical protein